MRVNLCPNAAYAKLSILTPVFYRLSSVTSCISMVLSDIFQRHCLLCLCKGLALTFSVRPSHGGTVCCGTACWPALAQYLSYRSQGLVKQDPLISQKYFTIKNTLDCLNITLLELLFDSKVGSVMPIGSSLQYVLRNGSCLAFIFCCLFWMHCFAQTVEDYGIAGAKPSNYIPFSVPAQKLIPLSLCFSSVFPDKKENAPGLSPWLYILKFLHAFLKMDRIFHGELAPHHVCRTSVLRQTLDECLSRKLRGTCGEWEQINV